MGRSLLSSDGARFVVDYLIADDSLSDVARGLSDGHAVAASTGGSELMPAELAPTSVHHAGYSHVRIRQASVPEVASTVGANQRMRAGP